MGKNRIKKNKKLVIKFDEQDRKTFLLNKGKKYSKKERKKYHNKLKQEEKRKEKLDDENADYFDIEGKNKDNNPEDKKLYKTNETNE